MENIRNNVPSTLNSSDQTIDISSETEIKYEYEPHPITNPEEIDDLVRQFE